MIPGIRLRILFGLSVVLMFLSFVLLKPDSRIDLSVRDYQIGQDIAPGWQRVCLFGQHEIPSVAERIQSEIPCELEFDVSSKTTTMVYYYKERSCEILRFNAYFINKNEYETRCFSSDDINNLKLQYKNEVINLEPK